jgi:hypothetical protein
MHQAIAAIESNKVIITCLKRRLGKRADLGLTCGYGDIFYGPRTDRVGAKNDASS